jgi:hypothetical protein
VVPLLILTAAAVNFTPTNPFSLPVADISKSIAINSISPYASIQEAIASFEELPKETAKSFIYTGNALNIKPMPVLMDLGIGKAATAHMIRGASMAYGSKGFT